MRAVRGHHNGDAIVSQCLKNMRHNTQALIIKSLLGFIDDQNVERSRKHKTQSEQLELSGRKFMRKTQGKL